MFYGDGLFLRSDNEKLQPHKTLPAGPQGAVRSVWDVHVCAGVCVCVCVHFHWMPSSRTYSLMSSFFFKCAATEDGEYFVYSIQKLSSNFLCNPEIWLNRFFLPKFGQGRPKTFNVIPFLCMWVSEQPEFICMGKGKKVLRPIKNPVLIGSQLFYRLRDA